MPTNAEKWENTLRLLHDHKPAPFNKDYNPEVVKSKEKQENYNKIFGQYLDTLTYPETSEELSDDDFNYLYNLFSAQTYLQHLKDCYQEKDPEYIKEYLNKVKKQKLKKLNLNSHKDYYIHNEDIMLKGKKVGTCEFSNNKKTIYTTSIPLEFEYLVKTYSIQTDEMITLTLNQPSYIIEDNNIKISFNNLENLFILKNLVNNNLKKRENIKENDLSFNKSKSKSQNM